MLPAVAASGDRSGVGKRSCSVLHAGGDATYVHGGMDTAKSASSTQVGIQQFRAGETPALPGHSTTTPAEVQRFRTATSARPSPQHLDVGHGEVSQRAAWYRGEPGSARGASDFGAKSAPAGSGSPFGMPTLAPFDAIG